MQLAGPEAGTCRCNAAWRTFHCGKRVRGWRARGPFPGIGAKSASSPSPMPHLS